MTFACLTKSEIRAKYDAAEDKSAMLRILADLTSSSPKEVAELLDVPPPRKRAYRELDKSEARALFDEGLSDQEIANACCVAEYVVAQWRRDNNLSRRKTLFSAERIEELYRQGLDDGEIAEALNCSRGVAARWRRLNSMPPNWSPRKRRRKRKRRKRENA